MRIVRGQSQITADSSHFRLLYHMKKRWIIANWKSYKTRDNVKEWLEYLAESQLPTSDDVEVIVCPPYLFLAEMATYIVEKNLSIKLGVQDISQFGEGSYTGAINVDQASDYVDYAIVGHSERRKHFHENDDDTLEKTKVLLEKNITPILCISDLKQLEYYLSKGTLLSDNAEKIIFVYEPPGAISGGGTFHPEDPESANANAKKISEMIGKEIITLYGGSVNPDNAAELFSKEAIDGGLIGKASLDPASFLSLIRAAM